MGNKRKGKKAKDSYHGDEIDLSQVDITAPLRPDEVIPKIEHRVVADMDSNDSSNLISTGMDDMDVRDGDKRKKEKAKERKKRKEKRTKNSTIMITIII